MNDIKALRFTSINELMQALASLQPPVYFLAGGTDLMVWAKDDQVSTSVWIDISDIPELHGIRLENGELVIGGGVTHHELMRDRLVQQYAPALAQAAANVGSPQIRARGTIGGNVANGSPAADTVPALMSLEAVIELASPNGHRMVPMADFASGPRRTVRKFDEVIYAVHIPAVEGALGVWKALAQRKALAISKISVAVCARRVDGKLGQWRISFGSVGPTVLRAREAERILNTQGYGEEAVKLACAKAVDEVKPISDIRSTAEYRKAMSEVLLADAIAELLS